MTNTNNNYIIAITHLKPIWIKTEKKDSFIKIKYLKKKRIPKISKRLRIK